MDALTGEAVPAAALRAELCGGDEAAARRALAALARAQAAGVDVSSVAGACAQCGCSDTHERRTASIFRGR
jgi:hypothetical protein